MIIHRYSDGSEGYEYEIGDRVTVERTIHGGWLDIGPTLSDHCTVKRIEGSGRHTAIIEVSYSPFWGPASCFPWMLKPHAETLAVARDGVLA